ncbi:hypothetical protein Daura_29670 [Dactylosporangium aurantiacum]|uniref:Uncharacterized protein n=1 Tax=Dactylosporangium aurantiacum TaxID=35754 RepID=A0A9Q9ICL5_9ACTN|nr:hypothetical protein [Dactylosporangium aurantiacum]MDG6106822.1 hypothetical protein [Dactylosporangium aurantiacum]UWZ50959.1 hypothetical protein Daura_29670 [Dactylosporangium aurantiacum]
MTRAPLDPATGRRPSDLVQQLWLSVMEEVFLWNIGTLITDYRGGAAVSYGPWAAEDCRLVLLRWFDRGLLDCVATRRATTVGTGEVVHYEYEADWRDRATVHGQHLILARDDAGALLRDPGTWRTDGVGAGVMLCRSDDSDGWSFDDWFAALAGLPDELLYGNPAAGEPA